MCVKHGLSEPLTACNGLLEKMEQNQKYLHRVQKSIDKAITNLLRYSEDYQKVLNILYKGNGTHRVIKSNGVDNDTNLPAPLPMTEYTGSDGKKLAKLDSWTAIVEKKEVNHSFELLVLASCVCFMVILFFTFILWVERKKLNSMKSKKLLHKVRMKIGQIVNLSNISEESEIRSNLVEATSPDEKKKCNRLNNVQVTVQTQKGEQDKYVSSLTRSPSSPKIPLVQTTDQWDFEKHIDLSHPPYKSVCQTAYTSPMLVKDFLYEDYPLSFTPDLPSLRTVELDTSDHIFSPVYAATFIGNDYCKDNTEVTSILAEDGTCFRELVTDTDYISGICLKKNRMEIPLDSECTSFEDRKVENVLGESQEEAGNLSEVEKRQVLPIFNEDFKPSPWDIIKHDFFESEQKEINNCHFGSEDSFETDLENNTGNYRSENTKENANSTIDKVNNNFGKQIAKSQRLKENAKVIEENTSMHDCRQTTNSEENNKYLNVDVNAPVQNVEENADMQNVQGKTNLQNVEESSNLPKITVDLYSQNVKKVPNLHVSKVCKGLIPKVNDTCVTNLNQHTRKNEDNSVPIEEKFSYYAKVRLVDIDVSTLEVNEVKDTSRTSLCARTDLRENKSLNKDALSPVSIEIQDLKEAECNLNKKTTETEQNCNAMGEMHQGIKQDKKTFLTDENIQGDMDNGSVVTEQHCNDTGKMYHLISQDKKTFLIDENVQADVDCGTMKTVHVENMQRDMFYEKTATMIGRDTFSIDTALFVKTTEGNLSDKSTPLKIVREIDKKTELNNSSREIVSVIRNLEHSFPCPFTVEEKTDLPMTFSWKMRTSQASDILQTNTSGEKAVQEEISCTSKDCIKVICMVLMLTDTIEQNILLRNKMYIEMKDNSSIVLNEGRKVSRQGTLSDNEGFLENNIEMGSKSCRPEKVQEDMSLIRPNKQVALHGNDAQFTTLNTKEKYGTLHVSGSFEEIISIPIETIVGKFSWIKNDIQVQEKSSVISHGTEKTSIRRILVEDGGFPSESFGMKRRCSSKKKGQEESLSWNKLIRERANKGRDEQTLTLKKEGEILKANGNSEEILPREIIQVNLRWANDNLKVKQSLFVYLLDVEQASIACISLENKVLTEKGEEQDDECFKQENFEEVSLVRMREEKRYSNEINGNGEKNTLKGKGMSQANITENSRKIEERCAYSHSCFGVIKLCFAADYELETRKGDFDEEQKTDFFALNDNMKDKNAPALPIVKKTIGHTESDITRKRLKFAAAVNVCLSKQVPDTIAFTESYLFLHIKAESKERDPGFKLTKHCSTRGPISYGCDLSDNLMTVNDFAVNLKQEMKKQYHPKQNPKLQLRMKISSVDCGLKSRSYQGLDINAGFHTYTPGLKNKRMSTLTRVDNDFVSNTTDEESVSSLLNAADQKTNDYSDTTYKDSRKLQPKIATFNYRYFSCITGENSFPKNQRINLFVKVKKLSQLFKEKYFYHQYSQKPQRKSNLDTDERVKFAKRKHTMKQSHCTWEEQYSSFYKSFGEGFGLKQKLHIPLKLENDVSRMMSRISSNESTEQSKVNNYITQSSCSLNHRNMSEVGDKSDIDGNPSFESSHTVLEQNLRPEIDHVARKVAKESNDFGFGSIESYGSDFILEMKTLEPTFQDNKVKLSSKETKKLGGKLREKDNKLKKELSADYIITILYPLYFRPELSSVIVYPVQRLQGSPISHEESFNYEWLRLESLRHYDGAGCIIRLARGGFYHDPVDGPLSTRCYACNVLNTNWRYFANVTEVHRRLSPNCPHLRENASVSGNVSIDSGSLDTLPNRTGSSVTVNSPEDRASEHNSQSATAVSSITDPLRDTQIRDMVSEDFQQQQSVGPRNTEYDRDCQSLSATGHRFTLSSGPSNLQGVNNTTTSVNSASSAQTSDQTENNVQGLNNPHLVHVTNPKHSEYATIDSRARSFTSMWPSYLDQTPQQMADAGFFYAGVADFTRCFACGGGLRNWEAGDDPCLQHTRWFPRCEYMNKLKGSRYVDTVTRRQEEHLVEERRRNAEQQTQKRQEIESLKAEHAKLREKLTCKICLDKRKSVTLLPCGHLVCCVSCSLHFSKCPICRCKIDRSIRTFMS